MQVTLQIYRKYSVERKLWGKGGNFMAGDMFVGNSFFKGIPVNTTKIYTLADNSGKIDGENNKNMYATKQEELAQKIAQNDMKQKFYA